MIGLTVGHYRIVGALGAGGMGVVYRAVDDRLQRHVAVKALPASVGADAERRRRFLLEARAASALNDPHIVTIHDICTEGGADFLVMELVQGRTLRELAGGRQLPEREVLDIGAQIAEGLRTAHEAGIVHRDLKPGNVMVTDRGHVKVLDFGLAKVTQLAGDAATLDTPRTQTGVVLGTLEYMAPEQIAGGVVDGRADVFALGAVLYELLTGTRAFAGEHAAALMHAILYGAVPTVRDRRPDVSTALADLVGRMLERDPAARLQTMDEVATTCRRLLGADGRDAVDAAPSAVTVAPAPSATARPSVAAPVVAPSDDGRAAMLPVGAPTAPVALTSPPARRRRRALPAAALVVLVGGLAAWRGVAWPGGPAATTSLARVTGAPGATPSELTAEARARLRRFDRPESVEAAIQGFEQALARDGAHAPAWAGLALAYWRQFRATRDTVKASRALDAARTAVQLDDYLAEGHVALGLAQLAGGTHDDATASFQRALDLDPGTAQAHRGLGEVAEAQDRRAEAQAAYERAASLDPADWELPRLAGNVHFRAGRYGEALTWYQKAAALAPDVAVPHALVGGTFHMLGDYPRAAEALQRAITLQPTAGTYSNLGTVLFFQGRFRDATAAFEKAVGLLPNDPLFWGNLGDAYANVPASADKARDAYTRAVQLLEQQLAKEPANVLAQSRLALYAGKLGDRERARTLLRAIPELAARDLNTLYRAAVTNESIGARDDALRWLERALDGGYPFHEVAADPSLTALRGDVRYHRLALRFDRRSSAAGR
jgi:tetratricopeptide (TPR) repeat protein/predicted Ser/Thr protein kinase